MEGIKYMAKSMFDIIKKQNGEKFAKEIRDTDSRIFEIENLPEIYAKNKDVPFTALNLAIEYQKEIDFSSPIVQNDTKGKNYAPNEKSYISRIQSLFERRNSNRRRNR